MPRPGTRTRPDPTPGEPQSRAAAVRSVDAEKRTVDVIASTETEDSHGTILVQDWDLERFNRNPVVLWAHNATLGMDELPIGRCTRAEVVDGALECTIQFAGADVNPRAEQVFQAYRQGFLRAVSVGFNPRSYRWEERDGREVLVLYDNELIELSCVPVGSNPDALARAMAARSNPGPTPTETDHMAMTEEERKLWELGRRTLELLNEKDPAAGEATLRGVLDNAKTHEGTAAQLSQARAKLAELNRAAALDAAVREGRLPPRAEWTEEQAAYLAGLDALAPAEGQRSPLDAYLRTLTPRAPVGPKHQPEGQGAEGAKAGRSILGDMIGEKAAPHLARARAEKNARRGLGEKVS